MLSAPDTALRSLIQICRNASPTSRRIFVRRDTAVMRASRRARTKMELSIFRRLRSILCPLRPQPRYFAPDSRSARVISTRKGADAELERAPGGNNRWLRRRSRMFHVRGHRLVERILVRRIDQSATTRRRPLILDISQDQIEFRQLRFESFDQLSVQQFRNVDIEHLRAA